MVEPYKTRLEILGEKGTTVRLNRDVEQLKIELSDDSTAGLSLDFIEQGLAVHVEDAALTTSAQGFLDKLGQLLEQVRNDLPEANPVIFMGSCAMSSRIGTRTSSALMPMNSGRNAGMSTAG